MTPNLVRQHNTFMRGALVSNFSNSLYFNTSCVFEDLVVISEFLGCELQPKRRCEFLCRGLAVLVPHSRRYQIIVRGPSLIGESLLAPFLWVFSRGVEEMGSWSRPPY